MEKQKWALCIDEATTKNNIKCVAMAVRFWDAAKNQLKTQIFDIVELREAPTSETIFKTVESSFNLGSNHKIA